MLISIIHPSRSRPQKSFNAISTWISRASCDFEVIVSLDESDPNLEEYHQLYANLKPHKITIIENQNTCAVQAINKGAEIACGDIFVVVSDDFDCPANWGKVIQKLTRDRADFLLKINDGTQEYIVTLPIMDRGYYSRFGYIYEPSYQHMFCDTHLTHVADILNKLIIRNDVLFRHNHYSVTKTGKDDVSLRADLTWESGKRLYLQHVKNKFGFKNIDVMNLRPEGRAHLNWLRKALA